MVAESEQMRKEADDTGPKAELEHWRLRMAKFNSLLEQIKGYQCRTVIGILQSARSRVLKVNDQNHLNYFKSPLLITCLIWVNSKILPLLHFDIF